LRHTSAAHEKGTPSFERLEFLGDAALSHAVAELLFRHWPNATEGQLTRARAALVRERTLATIAATLDLGASLELGGGLSGESSSPAVLADALEGVLGAVLLDGGWRSLKRVVGRLMRPLVEDLRLEDLLLEEPKSTLQELAQRRGIDLPVYRLLAVEGPAHRRTYLFEVEFDGRVLANGEGTSKRSAQQEAARRALEVLGTRG
jgi:ribonuclease-3